jgi:hypothetical protein
MDFNSDDSASEEHLQPQPPPRSRAALAPLAAASFSAAVSATDATKAELQLGDEMRTKASDDDYSNAEKARALVAALMASEDGRNAIKEVVPPPPPPVDCFIINRASYETKINEGFCAYVRRNKVTEFIFILLAKQTIHANMHLLGGIDISWENEDEMINWVNQVVKVMTLSEQRSFFHEAINVSVGYQVNDRAWCIKTVCQQLRHILMETNYPTNYPTTEEGEEGEPLAINSREMENYINKGNVMRPLAVFTFDEDDIKFF